MNFFKKKNKNNCVTIIINPDWKIYGVIEKLLTENAKLKSDLVRAKMRK